MAAATDIQVLGLDRSFRWRRSLDDGRYTWISDIANADKFDRGACSQFFAADPADTTHRQSDPGRLAT
jgi:hypothetical protein